MKYFSIYNLGTFLLFLGLLWMFLPHTSHEKIINNEKHIVHIIEGLILTLIGLGLMILERRKFNRIQ